MSAGVVRAVEPSALSERLPLPLLRNLLSRPEILDAGLRILTVARARHPRALVALALDSTKRPVYLYLVRDSVVEEHIHEATARLRDAPISPLTSPALRPVRVLVVCSGDTVSPQAERTARRLGAELLRLRGKPTVPQERFGVEPLAFAAGARPSTPEESPSPPPPPQQGLSPGSGHGIDGAAASLPEVRLTAEEIDNLLGSRSSASRDGVGS